MMLNFTRKSIGGATIEPHQRSVVRENNNSAALSARPTAEQVDRGTRSRRARRRSAGFSLVEILIALGIFLIGMTAIVSLFPAAAILQRETTQEVIAGMASQSARSIIESQSLTYTPGSPGTGDLRNYHSQAGPTRTDVVPFYSIVPSAGGTLQDKFPSFDRSYPTGVIDMGAANAFDAIADCDLHWVPFIQDLNGDQTGSSQLWVVRLFIVESDSRATYTGNATTDANPTDPDNFPKVRAVAASASGNEFTAAGTDLEPGDIVMDSNGNSHLVTIVDNNTITVLNSIPQTPAAPNTLWYAPRLGGSNSPTQRVVTVEVTVVNNP
jgi:type II secretory pathway pseudopilin PulG